jgi:PAS domain S-box-containing protein
MFTTMGRWLSAARWPAVAGAAGLTVAALGIGVLFGWAFDIAALKTVLPNLPSMTFNTAFGLVLDGFALFRLATRRNARHDRTAQLCAGVVAAVALLTLIEYAADLDLRIDQLIVADQDYRPGDVPGRMSVITALCLILFGAGTALVHGKRKYSNLAFLSVGTTGLVLAFLAIVGYAYGAKLLYRPLPSTSIALHTSIALFVTFVGLAALRPDIGWVALLRSPGAGGAIARRLLPVVVIGLPVIGWLKLKAQNAGLFDIESGVALLITTTVALLAALVWFSGRQADALDAQFRASERRYRQVVDDIQEAIWIHADGKIVFANPYAARMFGASSPEDLVGRPVLDLVHQDDREQAAARTKIVYEEHKAVAPTEMRMVRLDGTTIVTLVQAIPIVENGRPCIMSTGHDVTAQRDTEAQLRQSQKMEAVGRLTGGIAHDFNNLLTVILGNADVLTEDSIDDNRRRDTARLIVQAASRSADLTRRLLAFSRRQPLQPQRIEANALTAGLESMLRRTLGEKIELEMRPGSEVWPLVADPAQVESALLNLAVNARDAMPSGGKLTIETANVHLDEEYAAHNAEVSPGDYVLLAVSDMGTGMPAHILERAFEPFFTTKGPGEGTGLGLSMVFGFAKQSRGHVKIYSEVGHGTVVKLYLPRAETAMPVAAETVPVQEEFPRGNETILVVEDDADVRKLAVGQLQSFGYRVIDAPDGPSALELCAGDLAIDLLFTDVVMPRGMTGKDLADKLRERCPALRVLYASGYTENAIMHQGRIDAGVQLLTKPYRRGDLARMARKVLDLPA